MFWKRIFVDQEAKTERPRDIAAGVSVMVDHPMAELRVF
jgi:hypothetical protein